MKSCRTFPASLTKTVGPIQAIDLALYAAASGDHNPLHLDELVAKEVDFEKPVVHGMLSMAYLGRLLTDQFGVRALSHLHTRFMGIAMRGQTLQFVATLTQVIDGTAHYHLTVLNDTGAIVVEGLAHINKSSGFHEPSI